MAKGRTTPIIHLLGPTGSGKTTLCRLFLDAFEGKSVLAIDASDDLWLTLSYGVSSPATLGQVLSKFDEKPLGHEAIDWALQDLPVHVASESEADILPLGQLPDTYSPAQIDFLHYGLPRLFAQYDVVVWDGPIGFSESVFKLSQVNHLVVVRPEDEDYCRKVIWPHIWLLLSKAQPSDGVPGFARDKIQQGDWRFLGKLPPVSPEKRVTELPDYFQECFHKLDLPFEIH